MRGAPKGIIIESCGRLAAMRLRDAWKKTVWTEANSMGPSPRQGLVGRFVAASLLLALAGPALQAQAVSFLRGDANVDGRFDISDAVCTMRMIFLGDPPRGCDDAADVDDSGTLNITDGIYGMRYLFVDGLPPAAPFENCGVDPSADALGCLEYVPCGVQVECLDQTMLDGLVGQIPSFSFCLPAGVLNFPTDTLSISVCPSEGASACGATQTPGCPVNMESVTASVDVPGHALKLRFSGRVDDLPITVSESFLGTSATCLNDIHGASAADPFSFEAVLPLEVSEVSPGVEEITGTSESTIENVDIALTSSGGILCVLFQAGQGAFIDAIVAQLEQVTQQVSDGIGSQLVGLKLCVP